MVKIEVLNTSTEATGDEASQAQIREPKAKARKSRGRKNKAVTVRRAPGNFGAYQGTSGTSGEAGKIVMAYGKPASAYKFQCQLAIGSPTGIISGFTSAIELYTAIAEVYDMDKDEILYCTKNTHKVSMESILSSEVSIGDFIFAHIKGIKKEVEVIKEKGMLGLTISDNGAGKAFIKRLQKDSTVAACTPAVLVGDHIEKINGDSMLGKKHYEVAKTLKALPVGSPIRLRLIEPQRGGFGAIGPRTARAPATAAASLPRDANIDPTKTLRFKGGKAIVEDADTLTARTAIAKVNEALEEYLGVSDVDLARTVWTTAKAATDPTDLAKRLSDESNNSALPSFPDQLIFDFWGIVTDRKCVGSGEKEVVELVAEMSAFSLPTVPNPDLHQL